MNRTFSFLALSTILLGCASKPINETSVVLEAGKSGIYVITRVNVRAHSKVALDGVPIGNFLRSGFLFREILPGNHTIAVSTRGLNAFPTENIALEFEISESEIAYLHHVFSRNIQQDGIGMTKGILTLKRVTPEIGETILKDLR